MSGFRMYKTNWVSGQKYEDSPSGVKACLEDVARKFLLDSSYHGWSLDLTNCQDGEAVLLTPSYGVYAMFFIHTSGAKLMLSLNYRGLSPWFEAFKARANNPHISTQNTPDCSFAKEKMQDLANNYSTSGYNTSTSYGTSTNNEQLFPMYGGLFACIIPPQVDAVFDSTANMTSASFIPAGATKVVCTNPALVSMYKYTYASPTNTYTTGVLNANYGQSLIKRGDSKTLNSESYTRTFNPSYGVYNGDWCEYGIMIDEDGDVIVLAKSYNNTYPYRYPHWAGIVKVTNMPEGSKDSTFIVLQPNRYHGGYVYPGIECINGSNDSSYKNYNFYANSLCGISESGIAYSVEYSSNAVSNSNSISLYGKSGTVLKDNSYSEVMLQPFPYGLSKGYTNQDTNEFCYAMQPLALVGGQFKVRGIVNPDTVRMIKLSSNAIMEGTTLAGGDWLSVGYIMTFSGQSYPDSTGGSFVSGSNQSSCVAHLVVKVDPNNVETMF